MIVGILYAVGGIIQVVIGLRFILRVIGANPASGFVETIYEISTPFVAPFAGILGQDATVVTGVGAVSNSVVDWTALIALVVYGLLFGVVLRVFATRRG